ncbi:MAG: CHAP domain-containing protein [Chitinispirillaceae bacterium]|nr:CHAP domain-containing protein [Chitinispirillaceae bacterium]
MKHRSSISFTVVFITSILNAQHYQIQGTITNQADFPIKTLVVKLARAKHADTTDTSGAFLIEGDAITAVAAAVPDPQRFTVPAFKENRFIFNVLSGTEHFSIDLFTMRGEHIAAVFNAALGQGEHSLSIGNNLSRFSSAMLIAVVKSEGSSYRYKLLKTGGSAFSCSQKPQEVYCAAGRRFAGAAAAPIDTLLILRKDSVEYTIPITGETGTFEIMLDLLPYEITEEVAANEVGRGSDSVGIEWKNQNRYPYDLWRYLMGPEDAWCSEFLCWAYRCAGYPLGSDAGSTTQPKWMIKGNTTIRSWFQNASNKHEWVGRDSPSWESFVPVYGDFVRYDNAAGGHTGIVRYASGTSLYTIEGNVNNSVMQRTIRNYKNTSSSIDGFGRRSGVRADSYRKVN